MKISLPDIYSILQGVATVISAVAALVAAIHANSAKKAAKESTVASNVNSVKLDNLNDKAVVNQVVTDETAAKVDSIVRGTGQ